ncbi:divergent PAP2 family protein [Effusibacillus dendaii]|uniref:Membrane protein n=1 Tax=Effusibacillus dendaii TaxID=2743772 RepID=A0A7I8D8U9_9BACL|nr:divergent PAP2 family protein [Effusibacillus dendaii]BCJ86515.1 membrane protein [Effusibacillus dendaii]
MHTFFFNYPLVAALLATFLAQAVKVPIYFLTDKKWNWRLIFNTGGMPSSHSASVSCLAVSLGLTEGFDSPFFAIAVTLGLIVMYDAMGIRRHAGETAMALNKLEADFDRHLEEQYKGRAMLFYRRRTKQLKEMLGHQPIEVIVGSLLGCLLAIFLYYFWGVSTVHS